MSVSKATRAKVPPCHVYLVVYECGVMLPSRSRGGAELGRMSWNCMCPTPCGARIVRYTRGSLYGRGAATWPATHTKGEAVG